MKYDELPEIIDPNTMAKYMGLSVQFIYRHIQDGTIPAKKLGHKIRIRKETIKKLMEE